MTQKVLLPLYKIEVSYLVRHGRRWSALEHLILWACKSPRSSAELATQTNMPVRLISECLVNLLKANWIELRATSDGTLFTATRSGAAMAERQMPESFTETQPRTTHLFLERLTGEVFKQEELTVVYRHQSGFTTLDALGPEIYRPDVVGPELVARLPLKDEDTYERLRAPPTVLPGEAFAVLHFDEAPVVHGLPARTGAPLTMAIRSAIGKHNADLEPGQSVALPSLAAGLGLPLGKRGQMQSFPFGTGCLVIGGPEHLERATAVVARAERIVVVHSAFIGKNIQYLLAALATAAERGVQIYIHWGKKDDPEGIVENPSAAAARMARSSLSEKARAKIILGERTTGSHAKILLADTGEVEGYVALVGSCNWLDSRFTSLEASVEVTEPSIIGQIATTLAYLIAPDVGSEPVVSRLTEIYAYCAEQPRSARSAHHAMLVADEDHFTALRDAMNKSEPGSSVLVGSHKLGHAAQTTVFEPMREAARHGARIELVYTRVLPNLGKETVAATTVTLAEDAVALRQSDWEMHAKFIACNSDYLLVTSFNFMATTLGSRLPKRSEIGILITGPGVTDIFKEQLAAQGAMLPPIEERPVGRKVSARSGPPGAGKRMSSGLRP